MIKSADQFDSCFRSNQAVGSIHGSSQLVGTKRNDDAARTKSRPYRRLPTSAQPTPQACLAQYLPFPPCATVDTDTSTKMFREENKKKKERNDDLVFVFLRASRRGTKNSENPMGQAATSAVISTGEEEEEVFQSKELMSMVVSLSDMSITDLSRFALVCRCVVCFISRLVSAQYS
jgi:hypothetical protein